jgi:tetratricopeptide (TPR) repeat protein
MSQPHVSAAASAGIGRGTWRLAWLLYLLLAAGCQFIGRHGPTSGALLSCRQLTQRGISAGQRGDWAQAETLLAQAVKACPADCDSRRHYAESLWRRGAREAAVAQMNEAMRLSSDDPLLLVRTAEMQLDLGRSDAALLGAEQALDLNPKLSAAWALRGRVLQGRGELRQALADYQRSLSYAPNDRDALLQIAEIYRRLGEPQRALIALHSLLDAHAAGEEPQQALFLCGLAYQALDRHADAVDAYRLAAARGRPFPELLARLAESEWARGRPDLAAAAAQQALTLDPSRKDSQELLSRLTTPQTPNTTLRR